MVLNKEKIDRTNIVGNCCKAPSTDARGQIQDCFFQGGFLT